jgi:two-component system, chemotaxis family, sensor kinase CheA
MENINATFVTEAGDLINDLEKALLELEKDRTSSDSVANVFRVMHTLKGTAGMFGYDGISSLTHDLETIYDDIRNGRAALDKQVFDTTLDGLDLLKKLLTDIQLKDPDLREKHAAFLNQIAQLSLTKVSPKGESDTGVKRHSATTLQTYYILFNPREGILQNGTNTLYLVEDLLSLGDGACFSFFNQLPSFLNLQADLSYTGFELVLASDKSPQDLLDVFMFVENDCELQIIRLADRNILTPDAMKSLASRNQGFNRIGEETVRKILTDRKKDLTQERPAGIHRTGNVRVSSDRLDELLNLVSELVTTQASLSLTAGLIHDAALISISENIEKITRRLRDNAFSMSLLPLDSLVVRFERLIRDLSNELGKKVAFKTEGTETEIDKSIIEKLTDPVLHLLRNAIDHGIETPAQRIEAGKPETGTVLLKSYYSGASVVIEICDDGVGINLLKAKQKAIDLGLLPAEAKLSESEQLNCIFLPGVSTTDQVTDISGRGVGMDVVKRSITDLRGDIDVKTESGKGTSFIIRLPLTLSIIDGLLVETGGTSFILPLSCVSQCYEVMSFELENAFNHWITLDGDHTPFLYLRRHFGFTDAPPLFSQVIKVAHAGTFIGLVVDKVIGEYQAVLKPLGRYYRSQDEFSGATILGDGSVALILDPYRLIRKLLHKIHPDHKETSIPV